MSPLFGVLTDLWSDHSGRGGQEAGLGRPRRGASPPRRGRGGGGSRATLPRTLRGAAIEVTQQRRADHGRKG